MPPPHPSPASGRGSAPSSPLELLPFQPSPARDRGGQRVRDQPAVARIVGRGAEAFIAWKRRVNRELGEHPAGPRRHHHDPLREVDRLEHRMGDEHHGLAQRLPQRQEVVVEAKARDLVERGERLVHQQQRGLGDQRARDRGAHLHPTRKLARIALREAGKPDARERRVDARRRIGREPCEPERQAHIGCHRRPRHQGRLLEHEADAVRSYGPRIGGPAVGPRHPAARRRAQAGDDAQRRRLAAARGAEQRHELARVHGEIEALERDHAVGEGLADAVERNDGGAGQCRGSGGMNWHVPIWVWSADGGLLYRPDRRLVRRWMCAPTQIRAAPESKRYASVPIPKFGSLCGTLVCELRNRRTLATY